MPGRKPVCLDNHILLYLVSHFYLFLLSHLFLHPTFSFMDTLNSIPVLQFSAPTKTSVVPHESSNHIQTCSYRLSPRLIALVQSLSFSGEGDENPYLHIRDFEQTCDYLRIEGISDETLYWKLFPFSLKGKARQGMFLLNLMMQVYKLLKFIRKHSSQHQSFNPLFGLHLL